VINCFRSACAKLCDRVFTESSFSDSAISGSSLVLSCISSMILFDQRTDKTDGTSARCSGQERSHIGHHPITNNMKLLIAFENTGSKDRVSATLQARNLNFIKAAPSDFPVVGFTERPQPGYESYKENLPAFLSAQSLNTKLPLYREGYFLNIPNEQLLPITKPRIFVAFKDDDDATTKALSKLSWETYRKAGKGISGTLPFATGVLQTINKFQGRNGEIQAPYGSVSFESYPEMIQILRIFSQFFRTHMYPAYPTADVDEPDFVEQRIVGEKRKTDDVGFKDALGDRVKAVKSTIDGAPLWIHASPDDVSVVLKYAKPNDTAGLGPWGTRSDVPVTDGILFPFELDLSKDDKEIVPYIIERYFIQSLGMNVDEINNRFSKIVGRWRRDIFSSELGHILSHLAVGIKVALPCQARVFPIIENERYFGFYLAGAHYSLGLRGKLYHPVAHESNLADISAMSSHDEIILQICTMMVGTTGKKLKEIVDKCNSMYGVHLMLRGYNQTPKQLEDIRTLLPGLQFKEKPVPCTFDNIAKILVAACKKKMPDEGMYIHHAAVGKHDPLTMQLSRFGVAVPSPDIPGASKIRIPSAVPSDFPKGSFGFRKTSLDTAVLDWVDMVKNGHVLNGPNQLNSRFQHVMSKDKTEKSLWFEMMVNFRKAHSDGGIGEIISGLVSGDGEKLKGDDIPLDGM
jgi:hypothetical protein